MSPLPSNLKTAWSLQKRLVLGFGILLMLFLGFAGLVLDRAYKESVVAAVQERLQLRIFSLLAVAEPDDEGFFLPDLEDSRFSQIDSGLYGLILDHLGDEVWRSPSALNLELYPTENMQEGQQVGETLYGGLTSLALGDLAWASYGTYWENQDQVYSFVALESSVPTEAQIREFQRFLSLWFGALALILSVAQYMLLRWGMRPLQLLARDVSAIESGERDGLQGHYPSELEAVTNNLNMLIKSERERQSRYRTTLGDLAHSLKTPLAVMSSALQESRENASMPAEQLRELEEQLTRMDEIVSYQLRRAVKSNHANILAKPVPVAKVMKKLLTALGKVYKEKNMQVEANIAEDAVFMGEESDLVELCGVLLDNAFKYGRSNIGIEVTLMDNILALVFDDDGPGIAEQDRHWVLQRGARADTVTSGQGIGLAVAVDIVSAYGGEIQVGNNLWEGARVTVIFEQA